MSPLPCTSSRGRAGRALLALALTTVVGCRGAASPPTDRFRVSVAALSLDDVGDVAYAVTVQRRDGETVWAEPRLEASRYGNGRDLTYVGTCDASAGANPHRVTVEVLDLYGEGGGRIDDATYRNPGPVTVEAVCLPNRDTLVEVSIALMRDAQQGFFDVAVTFDEVFCSAKLDCKADGLLFDPRTSLRVPTAVVGLACAGGASTHLWLDELRLDCGGSSVPLDIYGEPGNQYSVDAMPPSPLAQVATYRGTNPTPTTPPLELVYFDVGLGVDLSAITSDCALSFAATASKSVFTPPYQTPTGTTWPVIHWNVDLVDAATKSFACAEHPLDDPEAAPGTGVYTAYVGPGAPHTFEYRVARDLAAPVGANATVMDRRSDGGVVLGEAALTLYADSDLDGLRDDGVDLPLVGAAVTLTGPETRTLTTDATGSARGPLAPGSYTVSITAGQEPLTGFIASSPALPTTIVIGAGATVALALGFVEAAEVRGTVFETGAGDLLLDGDEPTFAGVSLRFTRGGDVLDVTSGGDGRYALVLAPGLWTLSVDAGQGALGGASPLDVPRNLTLAPGEFLVVDVGVAP